MRIRLRQTSLILPLLSVLLLLLMMLPIKFGLTKSSQSYRGVSRRVCFRSNYCIRRSNKFLACSEKPIMAPHESVFEPTIPFGSSVGLLGSARGSGTLGRAITLRNESGRDKVFGLTNFHVIVPNDKESGMSHLLLFCGTDKRTLPKG